MKKITSIFIIIFLLKSVFSFLQIDSYYYESNKYAEIIKSQNITGRTILRYEKKKCKGNEVNKISYDSLGRVVSELSYFSINLEECDTLKYFYDTLGNQTKAIWYWGDSKEAHFTDYEYDDNNLLIGYSEYTIKNNEEFDNINYFRIAYDDKNRFKYKFNSINDTISICKYLDNNSAKVLHLETGHQYFYKNNNLILSDNKENKYNKKGNLILSKKMNKKGEIISQTKFYYKDGLLTKSKKTNKKGKVESREKYIYEKK